MVDHTKALEAHLAALSVTQLLHGSRRPNIMELHQNWDHDLRCLKGALPYVWADNSVQAVTQASEGIPGDTLISPWNLNPVASMWWYFETVIPVLTNNEGHHIQALNLAWVREMDVHKRSGFRVAVWCRDEPKPDSVSQLRYPLVPSQVWWWFQGETLDQMLARCRQEHIDQYSSPFSRYRYNKKLAVFPLEGFMQATSFISRFVLAAFAWLEQEIIITEPDVQHLPRPRRREWQAQNDREWPGIQLIHLRKAQPRETTGEPAGTREFSVQWVVGGHWRNQVCGPKRGDRRLTWIRPYIKGPADKPLKPQAQKVFAVDR